MIDCKRLVLIGRLFDRSINLLIDYLIGWLIDLLDMILRPTSGAVTLLQRVPVGRALVSLCSRTSCMRSVVRTECRVLVSSRGQNSPISPHVCVCVCVCVYAGPERGGLRGYAAPVPGFLGGARETKFQKFYSDLTKNV